MSEYVCDVTTRVYIYARSNNKVCTSAGTTVRIEARATRSTSDARHQGLAVSELQQRKRMERCAPRYAGRALTGSRPASGAGNRWAEAA